MLSPETKSLRLQNNADIYVTVGESGMRLSIYTGDMSAAFNMRHHDARALAERIINSLDNFQLQKEQDHANR